MLVLVTPAAVTLDVLVCVCHSAATGMRLYASRAISPNDKLSSLFLFPASLITFSINGVLVPTRLPPGFALLRRKREPPFFISS